MGDVLGESQALLVRRWGEMGSYWGISRTMAEIHALLFVLGRPMCTDDVMEQLHVSRGNASMNLRGLVDWGLVQRVHHLGDRKEYFQADTDVWHMFETITRERRRREVEPILATIERCRQMVVGFAGAGQRADEAASYRRRLEELRDFLTTMGALFELVLRFGPRGLSQITPWLTGMTEAGPTTAVQPAPTAGPPGRTRAARPSPRKAGHRKQRR